MSEENTRRTRSTSTFEAAAAHARSFSSVNNVSSEIGEHNALPSDVSKSVSVQGNTQETALHPTIALDFDANELQKIRNDVKVANESADVETSVSVANGNGSAADSVGITSGTSNPVPMGKREHEIEKQKVKVASSSRDIETSISSISAALEASGGTVDEFTIAKAREDIESARVRLGLSGQLTVGALIGGTGSGKSTLFNSISALDFADAGELRPMTVEAAACVWSADATQLLDLLEVRPQRRIDHDSLLTKHDSQMDGFVLLDLPDHDSIEKTHSATVNRVIPMADVLIWVLDPQKYADHLIHDSYLSQLRRRKEHMIVVLNKIDTVPEQALSKLLDDVRFKLTNDGLADVPVYAVSALQNNGVDYLVRALKNVIADKNSAISTAEAELDAVRMRLLETVGDREPAVTEELIENTIVNIESSAGVSAVVQSLRHAGTSIHATAIARPERPATSLMHATRDGWMSHVKSGLPSAWASEMDKNIPHADRIRRDVGNVLDDLNVPKVATLFPRVLEIFGIMLAAFSVVGALVAWPFEGMIERVLLGGLGLGIGLALRVYTIRMQKIRGEQAADEFEIKAYDAVLKVVDEDLVQPTLEVLSRHKHVRLELEGAALRSAALAKKDIHDSHLSGDIDAIKEKKRLRELALSSSRSQWSDEEERRFVQSLRARRENVEGEKSQSRLPYVPLYARIFEFIGIFIIFAAVAFAIISWPFETTAGRLGIACGGLALGLLLRIPVMLTNAKSADYDTFLNEEKENS
ncbi:MAG: 50S ribosome-binding GTPase [Actinomycetaceae bacterium]|nr:50S ribosome-binding GTPase [Actinomycetaceae bacterium]